jgi:hypothetical protein
MGDDMGVRRLIVWDTHLGLHDLGAVGAVRVQVQQLLHTPRYTMHSTRTVSVRYNAPKSRNAEHARWTTPANELTDMEDLN